MQIAVKNIIKKISNYIKANPWYFVIAFLSLILMCVYLSKTSYAERHHDSWDHGQYFLEIVKQRGIPGSAECGQCYQPPLYYMSLLPAYVFARVTGLEHMFAFQLYSIFLMQVFLFFSYQYYGLLFKHKVNQLFVFALTAFWPSVIIHSVRVGNDLLLYPIFAAGLYLLLRWIKENKVNLFVVSLVTALAIATKSGGYALLVIFGIVFLFKEKRGVLNIRKWPGYFLRVSPIIFIIILLFVRKSITSADTPWPVENIRFMPDQLRIENTIDEYVSFDMQKYITIPFANPWDYGTGSDQYWTFLLKTFIWGEFSFEGTGTDTVGIIVQVLVLLVIIMMFIGLVIAIRRKDHNQIFGFTVVVILIVFSIAARLLIPFVTTGDFRYILPGLIGVISLFGVLLTTEVKWIARIIVILFGVLSWIFVFLIA